MTPTTQIDQKWLNFLKLTSNDYFIAWTNLKIAYNSPENKLVVNRPLFLKDGPFTLENLISEKLKKVERDPPW